MMINFLSNNSHVYTTVSYKGIFLLRSVLCAESRPDLLCGPAMILEVYE